MYSITENRTFTSAIEFKGASFDAEAKQAVYTFNKVLKAGGELVKVEKVIRVLVTDAKVSVIQQEPIQQGAQQRQATQPAEPTFYETTGKYTELSALGYAEGGATVVTAYVLPLFE
jgi:hypothetical protein